MSDTSEIEITPEMIEAGAACIAEYGADGPGSDAVAIATFEAMMRAHRRGLPKKIVVP